MNNADRMVTRLIVAQTRLVLKLPKENSAPEPYRDLLALRDASADGLIRAAQRRINMGWLLQGGVVIYLLQGLLGFYVRSYAQAMKTQIV